MKIVIINPTYNEKGNIEKLINTLEDEIFPPLKDHEMHILVADDNSPDGTADIVEGLMKKFKNLHIVKGPKKGLGAAYIRAMEYAIEKLDADVMFEMDADGQHDPTKVPLFIKKIEEGADFVIVRIFLSGQFLCAFLYMTGQVATGQLKEKYS
jgi:dolichol-phosphate mannosyltransferase